MLPFGVTIPATVPQGSEIPERLMNKPVCVYIYIYILLRNSPNWAQTASLLGFINHIHLDIYIHTYPV